MLQIDGRQVTRALITPPVVHEHVESAQSAYKTGEGPAAIERSVDADHAGQRLVDSSFGDRESLHGGGGDEVKARCRRRRGGHEENLPAPKASVVNRFVHFEP
jgi:hypothetical protein